MANGKTFINDEGDLITGTSDKIYTASEYSAYGTSRYNAGYNAGQSTGLHDYERAYGICQTGWALATLVVVYVNGSTVDVKMACTSGSYYVDIIGRKATYRVNRDGNVTVIR